MLFQLIKKEVLLAKSYVLLMLAVCVAFPPFLLWRSPEQAGILGFVLSAFISVLMCLQYVSLKETQYPKPAALLCALPFSRRDLVLSKYLFSILIYLASCLIFGVETLFFPQLATVGIETPVLLFFAISLLLAVYLPVQYKLGYEKTRLFFAVFIMASPFLFSWSLAWKGPFLPVPLRHIHPLLLTAGSVAASVLVLALSSALSVRIYQQADLS